MLAAQSKPKKGAGASAKQTAAVGPVATEVPTKPISAATACVPPKPSKSIPQKLKQRPSGYCYFKHKGCSVKIHRRVWHATSQKEQLVTIPNARYEGEWTLKCTKAHVHSDKACGKGAQRLIGFGKMTYKIPGDDHQVVEEGHFQNGNLVTGSDSSDSDIDINAPDELDDNEEEEEKNKDEASAAAAAGVVVSNSEEWTEVTVDSRESKTSQPASAAAAHSTSSTPVSEERPSTSVVSQTLPAAEMKSDSDHANKRKRTDESKDSSPQPAAAKKSKVKQAATWTSKSQSSKAPSKSAAAAALADTSCVLFRHEPASSKSKRPKGRVIPESQAEQFEAAAARAASQRLHGGRSKAKEWDLDGWTYRGSMKNGKRHGFGVTTFDSGSVYKGMYKNDQCHGHGIWLHWVNGQPLRYEGGWKEELESGEGVLHENHSTLGPMTARGHFEAGEMEGQGEWKLDSGHIYFSGVFHRGRFASGRLNSIDPPSEYYVGTFDQQEFAGAGTLRMQNGTFFHGYWSASSPQGPGIVFVPVVPTGRPLAPTGEWRILPAIYKDGRVISRWIQTSLDPSEFARPRAASKITDDVSGLDADAVWAYVQLLITQGLRQAIQLYQEEAHQTATSTPPALTTVELNEMVRWHLTAFDSWHEYHLISIPNSVYNGVRHGVCSFRIGGEMDVPMNHFSACAIKCGCHVGHTFTPIDTVSIDFVCDCGRKHGRLQPSDSNGENASMADDEFTRRYVCQGMTAQLAKVLEAARLMKLTVQFAKEQLAVMRKQPAATSSSSKLRSRQREAPAAAKPTAADNGESKQSVNIQAAPDAETKKDRPMVE